MLLEYYGDSTIWGADGAAMAKVSKIARVPNPAPSFVSIPGWDVTNKGVSGQHTGKLLAGDQAAGIAPWAEAMTRSVANVVIVNHAINDTKALSDAQYARNLRLIVSIARDAGKTIIFETPNPVGATWRRRMVRLLKRETHRPLTRMMEAMRNVAAEQGVPLIDQFAQLTAMFTGRRLREFVPDLEHPNQATYELKGKIANAALNLLLR